LIAGFRKGNPESLEKRQKEKESKNHLGWRMSNESQNEGQILA
jgi:hypothetical protein